MKKIGYIIAAAFAVFSLSVTSFALPDLIQGAEDAVDTVASDAEDILGGAGGSDTQADDPDPLGSDTPADNPAGHGSDTTADNPAGPGSDTTADNPAGPGSDTTTDNPAGPGSNTTTTDKPSGTSAQVTTTPPTNVSNAGSTNPSTGAGAMLGITALGMAAAGLTAVATRKKK